MDHHATMAMPTGLVGLTQPVMIHSSRKYACDLKKQTQEQCDWKFNWWRNWYLADRAYSLPVVYLLCAGIGAFMISNMIFKARSSRRFQRTVVAIPLYSRITSFLRYLASRQFRIGSYYSPALGPVLMVCILIIFATVMSFGPQPYNWPSSAYGGSPPLATRTGWLSLAFLPFLITFATKWNFITIATGISHERLQVYHRWTAWVMYILALVHTFPFIVINIKNGTMVMSWKTRVWYWSGVAALVPQTWLVFMSWGPLRNRYYETFKVLHFLAAAFFVPMLFIHCNFRLTSWDYFFATAAFYTFSFLVRWCRVFFINRLCTASLDLLSEKMVKVTVPTHVNWSPGQHFFIRFMGAGVHALSSHPFTAASIPSTSGKKNQVEFFVRTREGYTARLAHMAAIGSVIETKVYLDGPYGGVPGSYTAYDRVLLLAGGGGASFVVPLLLDLIQNHGESSCKHVDVVWVTKTRESISWFQPAFQDALQQAADVGLQVTVTVYVTCEAGLDGEKTVAGSPGPSVKESSSSLKSTKSTTMTRLSGRPDLAQIIANVGEYEGTLGIAACGPEGFSYDVQNAVASLQLRIAGGSVLLKEAFLHVETFGW